MTDGVKVQKMETTPPIKREVGPEVLSSHQLIERVQLVPVVPQQLRDVIRHQYGARDVGRRIHP